MRRQFRSCSQGCKVPSKDTDGAGQEDSPSTTACDSGATVRLAKESCPELGSKATRSNR